MIFQLFALTKALGVPVRIVGNAGNTFLFATGADEADFIGSDAVRPGDIVLFPEPDMRPAAAMAPEIEKWVLCQNHHYIFNLLDVAPGWTELGIARVVCTSHSILNVVAELFPSIPRHVVPYFVEPDLLAGGSKRPQIAYMPRKLPREANFIRGGLRQIDPSLADVPWVAIDGVPFEQAAASLKASAIFLSLSHREGFGLPPLEAMCAGCLVVGFRGGGGRDYATATNGLWCSEDDVGGAIHGLARAVDHVRRASPWAAETVAEGERTAARYTRDRTRDALRTLYVETGLLS